MKPLLIMLLSGVAFFGTAQDRRYDFKILKGSNFNIKDTVALKKLFNNRLSKSSSVNPEQQLMPKYLISTRPGSLYALPLDNMPCIMPDLSGYNMPNGATDYLLRNPIDRGIYLSKPDRTSVTGK